MKITDIEKDKALNPPTSNNLESSCRSAFIFLRIKTMIKLNPDLVSDPLPPYNDIVDSKVEDVKKILTDDIEKGKIALREVRLKINSQRQHRSFFQIDKLAKEDVSTYLNATPEVMRDRIITSVVWRTLGQNPSLLEPSMLEDLLYLVNRRLRMAERMLYDVGKGRLSTRKWNVADSATGPWKDKMSRIFEYPRLLQTVFTTRCDPDPLTNNVIGQKCMNPEMKGWEKKGDTYLVHESKLNVNAQNMWFNPPPAAPGDTAPPTVLVATPSNGSIDVSITSLVQATFSEAVHFSSVNTSTFILKSPARDVPGSVTLSVDRKTATFTPASPLAVFTKYTATITTDVKDPSGNPLISSMSWSFTTAGPTSTPTPAPPVTPNNDSYVFFFNRKATPPINPVDAIKLIFTPHEDFKERNLLFCDQVIHCLHLESLVFAKERRGESPDWLRRLVDHTSNTEGWLRIWDSTSGKEYDGTGCSFLANKGFEFVSADGTNELTVSPDTQVTFDFQDGKHTVVTYPANASNAELIDINNGGGDRDAVLPVPQKKVVSIKGKNGGEIRYHCGIHGELMKGIIKISNVATGQQPITVTVREVPMFEHVEIAERELIVGDHVVIWNHPAYDHARVDGVWRLENAIVVQTDPVEPPKLSEKDPLKIQKQKVSGIRLQGHGTYPLKKEAMVVAMMNYFNEELDRLRKIAKGLPIGTKKEFGFGGTGVLVFRDKFRTFDSKNQFANWWLVWHITAEEKVVAMDTNLRKRAEKVQKIWYIHDDNENKWYGAFPLWEAAVEHGNKFVQNAQGQVTKVKKVRVDPSMFITWTMYIPPSHKTGRLIAIRPKI